MAMLLDSPGLESLRFLLQVSFPPYHVKQFGLLCLAPHPTRYLHQPCQGTCENSSRHLLVPDQLIPHLSLSLGQEPLEYNEEGWGLRGLE